MISSAERWTLYVPSLRMACGREADVAHHGDIRLDQGLDGGRHLAAPFELDGLAIRLLENSPGGADRLPRRDLIAEKRQVGDDQRTPGRPGDHLGVVDDLVDRDAQGRFPALNDRPQRVADQQAIDAGRVEQPGGREVVGRQHGDPAALRLPCREIRNGDRLNLSWHSSASRNRPDRR